MFQLSPKSGSNKMKQNRDSSENLKKSFNKIHSKLQIEIFSKMAKKELKIVIQREKVDFGPETTLTWFRLVNASRKKLSELGSYEQF